MPIKSLKELKKLRKSLQNQVNLRQKGEVEGNQIEILIGMGTCGIAAGAKNTFNELQSQLKNYDELDVKLTIVGCVGFCHMEPTIQLNIPSEKPVLYGKITQDKVEEFIDTCLVKKELLRENYLIKSFYTAGVQDEK